MRLFHPLDILQSVFGHTETETGRAAIAHAAQLWRRAFDRDPELREDLIRQSGLLTVRPVQMADGVPIPVKLDPLHLAYEQGRRDLALQLLSAGGLTTNQINQLIEDQRYE